MARKTRQRRYRRRTQRGGEKPEIVRKGLVANAKAALNGTDIRLDKIYTDAYYYAFNKFVLKVTDKEAISAEIKERFPVKPNSDTDVAIRQGVDMAELEYIRLSQTPEPDLSS
jgi:hypothetical protein